MFGWYVVEEGDTRCAAAFALMLVMLGLAYPLAFPYPVLIIGALAVAYRRRPRLPAGGRSRVLLSTLGVLVLAPAIAGAIFKLVQGLGQILSSHSSLWSGDLKVFFPIGAFAGTGGGVLPALAVLALALAALRALPRRAAWALGASLGVLLLVDAR